MYFYLDKFYNAVLGVSRTILVTTLLHPPPPPHNQLQLTVEVKYGLTLLKCRSMSECYNHTW